jgi:hypothetical protein
MSSLTTSFAHVAGLLLAGGLAACADYTGPDGSRINGPQVRETGFQAYTLTYTVENFHPHEKTSQDYLRHVASREITQEEHTGRLTLVFLDQTSGQPLLTNDYEVLPDLLFQHKIHLLSSESASSREAPE